MLSQTSTPTVAEIFVGDLAVVGNWVVANVRSSVAWPLKVETVEFRGYRIFLVPRTTATVVADGSTVTMYPFAAVKMPDGAPFKDGRHLLSQFLSSLSWWKAAGSPSNIGVAGVALIQWVRAGQAGSLRANSS